MKKLLAVLLTSFMMLSANATVINGINYGNGLINQISTVYFSTIDVGGVDITHGVGYIESIWQGGVVIWTSGDNGKEYNFVLDNIETEYLVNLASGGGFEYGTIGGDLNFYANALGTFNVTGDFNADRVAIEAGVLNIGAEGHLVTRGSWTTTVTGTRLTDGNSGLGQLDIMSGAAYDAIVQDAIVRVDGSYADLTFNYSSDNLLTSGYDWSGSSDMVTQAVPEPNSLGLLGLGLLGLLGSVGIRRK